MKDFGLSRIEDKWVEEKTSENLADLPEGFYDSVAKYAVEVKREIKDSQNLRRDLLQSELKHVLNMVQEVYLLRVIKIMNTLFEEESANLLSEERQAFNEIRERLEDLRNDLIAPAISAEPNLEPPEEFSNISVVFLSEVPEPITASDMNYYGPFEEGDVANLPKKSAELLVDQGLAKRVEISEVEG